MLERRVTREDRSARFLRREPRQEKGSRDAERDECKNQERGVGKKRPRLGVLALSQIHAVAPGLGIRRGVATRSFAPR